MEVSGIFVIFFFLFKGTEEIIPSQYYTILKGI